MKQILQSLKTGNTEIAEVPCPRITSGSLLIRTSQTLISAGTERMLVEFGKAGWINKSRQQPDKVRMVLDKMKTDGVVPTIEAVFNKLDQPMPLGYCNMGTVVEVGSGVTGFAQGDRVICNGKHAEMVTVPLKLCARVPDNVSDEQAAFAVLGAIALQGIRLVKPTLGETIVVTGLGLIGLMTVQLLRANGCRVLGLDFNPERLNLAKSFGAETVNLAAGEAPVTAAQAFSRHQGVDAVIITASTKSNEPVHQAAQMCRKRGRIVLVGVVGLELSRTDFFEKELTFQVSCSYGPGRYDPDYENKGQDYPIGYVRWTEQRNFEAVLDMMADGRIDVEPLISHRMPLAEAQKAYEIVGGSEPSLAILLEYHMGEESTDEVVLYRTIQLTKSRPAPGKAVLGFIGSGNYATAVLIPAFKASGAQLKLVASSGGVSGVHAGRKYGFEETTTDSEALFSDEEVTAIVISTRHDSHAGFICRALEAGKHVFVEKPLALSNEEMKEIETILKSVSSADKAPILMVGFNRRFAPQIEKINSLLAGISGPKSFVMTVNAGAIPADHWTQDREVGGGRIIGEACHFIDLLRFLAKAPIVSYSALAMDALSGDTATINLRFADGSIGSVHYFANGSKSFSKERLDIFASGKILQLDNFRRLSGYGWTNFSKMNLIRQNKGQIPCVAAFVHAIETGGQAPIPYEELLETANATIAADNLIHGGNAP